MADNKLTKDETELVSPDGTEIVRVSVSPYNTGATNRKITFNNFLSWIASGVGLGNYLRKSGADTGAEDQVQNFTNGIQSVAGSNAVYLDSTTVTLNDGSNSNAHTPGATTLTNGVETSSVAADGTASFSVKNLTPVISHPDELATPADAVKINNVKCYRALTASASEDVPASTVLENTLGITPAYSYVGAGVFRITAAATFTVSKTFITINTFTDDAANPLITVRAFHSGADTIELYTSVFAAADDTAQVAHTAIPALSIQVLVYP